MALILTKGIYTRIVLILSLLGFNITASAQVQAEAGSEAGQPAIERLQTPGQFTVVGKRTLRQLRLRIENKQAEIFAFFNANNSSDRYDILCNARRITGTHISTRECEPRFLRDLRVERTRQYRMGFNTNPDQRELVELAAADYTSLQLEMQKLIQAHPAFAEDFADLALLQKTLKEVQAGTRK